MSDPEVSAAEQTARGETVSPLALFRVKAGCRFGAANQFGPGEVVELPAAALTAFGDKLEAVSPAETVDAVDEVDAVAEPSPKARTRKRK